MATSRFAPFRDRGGARALALALPCLLLVAGGAAWRWPTLHRANYLLYTASRLAYSDVVSFYGGGIAPGHQLPYLQRPLEYPVLTGLILWLTGYAPRVEGYFLANSLLLGGCLLGCYALLAGMGPGARPARFALAPGLALYGILNWDAPALLCLVAALRCVSTRRWGLAGTSLALGISAKLFPIFVLPVLIAHSLRAGPKGGRAAGTEPAGRHLAAVPPATLRLLAGCAVPLLALNLPLALLNWGGWSHWIVAQAGRGTNPDAIWAHIPGVSERLSRALMVALAAVGMAVAALRVRAGGRWEAGALLSLLAFLLFTRDYSPQYDLWILPLLAVLACPVWLWLIFVLADGLYDYAIFRFYAHYAAGERGEALARALRVAGLGVWWREAALALLAVWCWTQLGGRVDSVPAAAVG